MNVSVYMLCIIRARFIGNKQFKYLIQPLKFIKLHYRYLEVDTKFVSRVFWTNFV